MAEEKVLRFVRTSDKARPPVFGSQSAAGADLCSAESCIVPAKGKVLVSTGLRVAIPSGHYGRVAPRSGLAVKHSIDVGAGVIDTDYRGELKNSRHFLDFFVIVKAPVEQRMVGHLSHLHQKARQRSLVVVVRW
uniref:Deoxyuridine 5'-triphosphate nucleotidohydrolase n=1 Tax=Globodera pallida TaxID=36090 RepID=A0A183BST5_GLOPA